MLVLQRAHVDLRSVPELAPQALGDAAAVVGDHRVRSAQDGLRGAVVLLQLDHAGIGEVVLEVEDVAYLGTAKAVDRLRIVAHHREVAVAGEAGGRPSRRSRAAASDEQLKQAVLRVVGVLVLVDEDVPECRDVALAHLGEQLEEVHGPEQQVVEVHRVHAVQVALVQLVHVGDHLLEGRGCLAATLGGGAKPVLQRRDADVDRRRRVALGVDADGIGAALRQPARIGLVVDRELSRVTQPLGLGAQDPRTGRVKGHQPHAPRAPA